jgi:hypothetical protein
MVRSLLHGYMKTCSRHVSLLALLAAGLPVGACAPTHLVVTIDPQLSQIRSVYVLPFGSLGQNPEAAALMREAVKAQLKYDRIFQVVEEASLADAYVEGMLGKWAWGGLDLEGARSSEVSGSLKLIDRAHQPLSCTPATMGCSGRSKRSHAPGGAWAVRPATECVSPLLGADCVSAAPRLHRQRST